MNDNEKELLDAVEQGSLHDIQICETQLEPISKRVYENAFYTAAKLGHMDILHYFKPRMEEMDNEKSCIKSVFFKLLHSRHLDGAKEFFEEPAFRHIYDRATIPTIMHVACINEHLEAIDWAATLNEGITKGADYSLEEVCFNNYKKSFWHILTHEEVLKTFDFFYQNKSKPYALDYFCEKLTLDEQKELISYPHFKQILDTKPIGVSKLLERALLLAKTETKDYLLDLFKGNRSYNKICVNACFIAIGQSDMPVMDYIFSHPWLKEFIETKDIISMLNQALRCQSKESICFLIDQIYLIHNNKFNSWLKTEKTQHEKLAGKREQYDFLFQYVNNKTLYDKLDGALPAVSVARKRKI